MQTDPPPDSARNILAYHVASPEALESIERDGFCNESGTYKATGMDLYGVFLSTRVLDSDDDRPETFVFAVDADEIQIAPYEIFEASADHRNYCVPAEIVNHFPRRRLTPNEARRVPVNDSASDPAYPPK
jgi:hypothetical protein